MPSTSSPTPSIAIIGTGFGGLGMGYYLKKAGIESFTIFEKASDVGGVWRENTYPGAACDVASHLYSYSFEPHYPWTCRYGKQAEILAYLRHVASKHGIQPHIRFGHEVTTVVFDDASNLWTLHFADGSKHTAQIVITAMGQLHRPMIPRIEGAERFKGSTFHSATWDHRFKMAGSKVAVIGTGASAVQFVPEIAKEVEKLTLFQRSSSWVIPKFDRPYKAWERRMLDRLPLIHDADRLRIFSLYEFLSSALQPDTMLHKPAGALLRFASKTLTRLQVKDSILREKLTPDGPLGCKRLLLSNDWLAALARPNVEVVTEGVKAINASGVLTADGRQHDVDAIIYGTGFAATEFLVPMEVTGSKGKSLRKVWAKGAEAYLGMSVAGFPNFFTLYGPNTNLGAGSIIYMLERQVRYVVQCVEAMQQRGWQRLEVQAEQQRIYNERMAEKSHNSPFESGCHSWYINAEGRNTNNWVGYMSEFGKAVKQPNFAHFDAD